MPSTKRKPPTDVDRPGASRVQFRQLIAANPNHFGTFPDLGLKVVDEKSGDTAYEALSCVAYSPSRDRIEATLAVKGPSGYGGGPCSKGTFEHLRFYVDYGSGWQDVGAAAVNVHDIPVGKDCHGEPTHPLSYTASVAHEPQRSWCFRPQLPRVRVILSWELPPPPAQPDWRPVWGDVRECAVQIAPRRFFFGDLVDVLPAKVLAALPDKLMHETPIPHPDPDPGPLVPLADLLKSYAKADVPQHRSAFPHLMSASTAAAVSVDALTEVASISQQAGIDLSAVLAAIDKTSGNVSFEELGCLGLDEGLAALVATFNVKQSSGYSGPPCSAGSNEYVSFWADWDDDCRFTYLGTVPVAVHDYTLPKGGLCYAAILPVDLGRWRQGCDVPVLRRVRAVLSWATPPSTSDPDALPVWGNRLDRHVQILPGRRYDGTARFNRVGGVAAEDVDGVSGLTGPGAKLGTSTVPLDPPYCPFSGTVKLQGPTDPALMGHQYRIRATNVDSGGSVYLTSPFGAVTSGGTSATITPNPVTGWASWPTWSGNTEGYLGVHRPGGDDRWDYHLELDTAGNDVAVARAQMDNTVRAQVLSTDSDNAGDLQLFTAGACKQPHGPLNGRFVARDKHFASWSFALLGGPGGPIPPTPLTVGITHAQQTPLSGTPFTLDLSSPMLAPCGYVVRLTIVDRAIVDSVVQGQHTTIDRGICLE